MRGIAREPGSGRAGDAIGWTGAAGRGVSGNDAGSDRCAIRRCLAPAGCPSRHQVSTERLLQTELRSSDHQTAERRLPGGREQRRRRRGPTVFGVPVRQAGRQHLTEHGASAQNDLQVDPLPAA